jgi:nucleotide-binding universal stress UspA family protein
MAIKRILCPTDLATGSDEALRYALALRRAYDAKLIAFHCQAEANEARQTNGLSASLKRSLLQGLNLDEFSARECESVVEACDDPGKAITEYAALHSVDLIVMHSRRRPHRAALLGSTAESVCRSAPCPVLVTHTDERDWVRDDANEIKLKRVLVAHDFSDYSELALRSALTFAQEYQAELHLLHVVAPFTLNEPEISWYPLGREGSYHKAARGLQQATPAEAHLWCQVKHGVSEGQPYREILNYAERNQIDLICLGAHGAGFGLRTLFGSNVDRVLRQAPCPVLVARPLKPKTVSLADFESRSALLTL